MQEQDNPPEEWRPVPGWEDIYSVSNLRRIRRDIGGLGTWPGRILIGHERNGAQCLISGSRREELSVARLVQQAFPILTPGEEWQPVIGYEGCYEVSNLGRIRSLKSRSGRPRQRLLKSHSFNRDYARVLLFRNGSGQTHAVHRLVAKAFLGPVPEGKEVNHKDGMKANNRTQNLEYVTAAENISHARHLGLARRGERRQ